MKKLFGTVKRQIIGISLALIAVASTVAYAQVIHGNTFPFWNVTGDLDVGGDLSVTGTTTLSSAPTFSALTASQAVFTNGSKALVSNAITGTNNVVMSDSPTLTGTIAAANQTLSGTLGVTGNITASSLDASKLVSTNGSDVLVSYAGTSCTNQFVRSLDAAGAATCASVSTSDIAASITLTTPNIGVASTR